MIQPMGRAEPVCKPACVPVFSVSATSCSLAAAPMLPHTITPNYQWSPERCAQSTSGPQWWKKTWSWGARLRPAAGGPAPLVQTPRMALHHSTGPAKRAHYFFKKTSSGRASFWQQWPSLFQPWDLPQLPSAFSGQCRDPRSR